MKWCMYTNEKILCRCWSLDPPYKGCSFTAYQGNNWSYSQVKLKISLECQVRAGGFLCANGETLKLPDLEPAMRSEGLWESLGTSTDGNQDHKASRDDVICTNSLPKDAVVLTNACALSWVSRAFGRGPPRWTINLLAKNQNIRKLRLFLCNVKMQLQSLRGYQKMAKGNKISLFQVFHLTLVPSAYSVDRDALED